MTANDCPEFNSLFICTPEQSRENLKYINLSNCQLSHFYPISLPNLYSLNLSGNILLSDYDDSPFEMGNYPNLHNLILSNNKGVGSIDLTNCPLLEQLAIDGCSFSVIDVSCNPELTSLNAANNNIKNLNLSANKKLRTLSVNGNPLTELDVKPFANISSLDISDTQISRIDLLNSYYLKSFSASNTKLEFVDFNGIQAESMTKIDLRNNPNFTPESMAYTIATLPQARQAYSTNLWLAGSNAEKANTAYATSADMHWISDVTGDGSAQWSTLALTFANASATQEKVTGELERLYPMLAMSLKYDLTKMHADGGDFVICQWQPDEFTKIKDVASGNALKGVPMCIYSYPQDGKTFKSVTVNGKEIESPWFIASEDATVSVNFVDAEAYITLNAEIGQEINLRVNTIEENGTVWIDWGAGGRTEYTGQRAYATSGNELVGSRITGTALAETVTIFGNLAGLDINGYGEAGVDFGLWDNQITGIDVTHAPDLKILTAYWNPIPRIDLSKNKKLEVLDLSYTAITDLDLSNNPMIISLRAYSSGVDEGTIRPISAINLTNMPSLQELNLKNNELKSIDLSKNTWLTWVDLSGNQLSYINLSNNPDIIDLNLSGNNISEIDLKLQRELNSLKLTGNNFSELDLSANIELRDLYVGENNIHALDLHNNIHLQNLYLNDNGMTAEELNDIFYLLPERVDENPDAAAGTRPAWDISIYSSTDANPNDYTGHDSSIAIDRKWTPSHQGSNNGCDFAYLDVLHANGGTITVADASGKQYPHGSKVEKWIPLTITAVPSAGYEFSGFSINGEAPISGTAFEMPGIYTKLQPIFKATSGIIDAANENASRVEAYSGNIVVKAAEGYAEVFNATGLRIAASQVQGEKAFALPAGIYIVRVQSGESNITKSVIVK